MNFKKIVKKDNRDMKEVYSQWSTLDFLKPSERPEEYKDTKYKRWYRRHKKQEMARRRANYMKDKAYIEELRLNIITKGDYSCYLCGDINEKRLNIVYNSFADMRNKGAYKIVCSNCYKKGGIKWDL